MSISWHFISQYSPYIDGAVCQSISDRSQVISDLALYLISDQIYLVPYKRSL